MGRAAPAALAVSAEDGQGVRGEQRLQPCGPAARGRLHERSDPDAQGRCTPPPARFGIRHCNARTAAHAMRVACAAGRRSLCQPAPPLQQVRGRLHHGACGCGLSQRATASATERLLHAIPERVIGPWSRECLEHSQPGVCICKRVNLVPGVPGARDFSAVTGSAAGSTMLLSWAQRPRCATPMRSSRARSAPEGWSCCSSEYRPSHRRQSLLAAQAERQADRSEPQ